MKDPKILYASLVKRALEILRLSHLKQMKIAKIALEVCEIRWGGKQYDSDFSLRRFAKDIGVKPKTLDHWIQIKRRVYDNVDPSLVEKMYFTDMVSLLKKTSSTDSRLKINSKAREILEFSPDIKRFEKYLAHVKSVLFNAKNPERLEKLPDELLAETIETCEAISRLLKYYLANKENHIKNRKNKLNKYNDQTKKLKELGL